MTNRLRNYFQKTLRKYNQSLYLINSSLTLYQGLTVGKSSGLTTDIFDVYSLELPYSTDNKYTTM